mmetsp:Transcript_45522/g.110260  ORF Transcript_45522/g.110260 Transcript_45522/m.110260 type:complete len:398 (-) Transcript_45522:258-1451(-)|eukprot:CAMPEP_0113608684 /NCGR_PEP_ID=MMETSP0017_2-20120614/4065_1 /TAXON_ID=2856 /ORGANISM="Cylindrotheca closterium" /LENGTH=397 /DNA_ID=CAMNT_0000517403 /DNA_START=226 /DNA_END=1419 /DNA_ORIENTATION=+ /assembly_acc=CAM_ASM_000147
MAKSKKSKESKPPKAPAMANLSIEGPPQTVHEDVEQATNYRALSDLPSPATSVFSTDSRQSVGSEQLKAKWKKKFGRFNKPTNHSRNNSINSVGSFSQSEDFKKLFDEDGTEPVQKKEEEEVYVVKQRWGYCSYAFSVGQVLVLIIMMTGCGIAPMNVNPMIGPYPDALSYWGGKNAVNIIDDGEWYRLITPIMLHAGVIHLLCNVAVQVETGAFFEREWGSLRWMIIYITSAIGSSALSVIKMPGAISVGSSGAVMGLFGAKLAEVTVRFLDRDKSTQGRIAHQVRKEQCAGVTCSVVVVMLFSFIPYVDWSAHLGGLIAGFCVGMVIFALNLKNKKGLFLWTILGTIITCIFYTIVFKEMYSGDVDPPEELRDVCGYYKQFFDDYECKCMRGQQN